MAAAPVAVGLAAKILPVAIPALLSGLSKLFGGEGKQEDAEAQNRYNLTVARMRREDEATTRRRSLIAAAIPGFFDAYGDNARLQQMLAGIAGGGEGLKQILSQWSQPSNVRIPGFVSGRPSAGSRLLSGILGGLSSSWAAAPGR